MGVHATGWELALGSVDTRSAEAGAGHIDEGMVRHWHVVDALADVAG